MSKKSGEITIDQQEYDLKLIEEFRAARGTADGRFSGRPLLLLTTKGAKTGQFRTAPVMYVSDGNRLIVIASNAGAPAHPAWYHNLVAYPDVTVEVGNETYEATAVVLEGEERQQVWNRIVEHYSFFSDHQTKTTRQIPLVALYRKED